METHIAAWYQRWKIENLFSCNFVIIFEYLIFIHALLENSLVVCTTLKLHQTSNNTLEPLESTLRMNIWEIPLSTPSKTYNAVWEFNQYWTEFKGNRRENCMSINSNWHEWVNIKYQISCSENFSFFLFRTRRKLEMCKLKNRWDSETQQHFSLNETNFQFVGKVFVNNRPTCAMNNELRKTRERSLSPLNKSESFLFKILIENFRFFHIRCCSFAVIVFMYWFENINCHITTDHHNNAANAAHCAPKNAICHDCRTWHGFVAWCSEKWNEKLEIKNHWKSSTTKQLSKNRVQCVCAQRNFHNSIQHTC